MKTIKLIVCFLMVLGLAGCASFPNQEIPKIQNFSSSQIAVKPSAFVDVKFITGAPDSGSTTENTIALSSIKPIVQKAVDDTHYFGKVSTDTNDKQTANYLVNIEVYNHGDIGSAMAAGFITGFSLFVIPTYATDNYTVKMSVVDRNTGNIIESTSNKDSIRTWFGIWLLPAAGNTPQEAVTSTVTNQVQTALTKIVNDNRTKLAL